MKKFNFKINGNSYEVKIDSLEDDLATVQVNGIAYSVELEKKSSVTKTPKLVRSVAVPTTDSSQSIAKTSNPSAPKGGGTIKSPLPGVILMENSIQADKAGVVEAIHFNTNDAVMEGDVLITIK